MTSEAREKLLLALRGGNYRQVACAYAGIPSRTFSDWMRRGREEPEGPWGDFCRSVIETEKSAEIGMLALVLSAARTDARHAEWWLARKHPSRWSEKVQVTVDEELTRFLRDCEAELPAETYRSVLRIAARRSAADEVSRESEPDETLQ